MARLNNTINAVADQSATNPEKNRFIASAASRAYKGPSIVDYLSLSGQPTNLASREALGATYGISGIGNPKGNINLLNKLREGQRNGYFFQGSPMGEATTEQPQVGKTLEIGTGQKVQVDAQGNWIDAQGKIVSGLEGIPAGALAETPAGTPSGTPTEPPTAYETYLKSLTPSPELTAGQTRLREMDTQAALDYEKALEMGDTLGFARGEAGLTARQNAILRGGQAATVQAYAALDAQRGEISKARYEYEKGKLDEIKEAQKPFTLGEGQEQFEYDPETGEWESVAGVEKTFAPKEPSKPTVREEEKPMFDEVSNMLGQLIAIAAQEGNEGYVPMAKWNEIRNWVLKTHGARGLEILSEGRVSGRIRIGK